MDTLNSPPSYRGGRLLGWMTVGIDGLAAILLAMRVLDCVVDAEKRY
jgi:hypothetical protein